MTQKIYFKLFRAYTVGKKSDLKMGLLGEQFHTQSIFKLGCSCWARRFASWRETIVLKLWSSPPHSTPIEPIPANIRFSQNSLFSLVPTSLGFNSHPAFVDCL